MVGPTAICIALLIAVGINAFCKFLQRSCPCEKYTQSFFLIHTAFSKTCLSNFSFVTDNSVLHVYNINYIAQKKNPYILCSVYCVEMFNSKSVVVTNDTISSALSEYTFKRLDLGIEMISKGRSLLRIMFH